VIFKFLPLSSIISVSSFINIGNRQVANFDFVGNLKQDDPNAKNYACEFYKGTGNDYILLYIMWITLDL